jgi:hypothetical protein
MLASTAIFSNANCEGTGNCNSSTQRHVRDDRERVRPVVSAMSASFDLPNTHALVEARGLGIGHDDSFGSKKNDVR